MNILVTDGENRSSLAVTRSLGEKGYKVVVTGERSRTLASASKFCMRGEAVPDPLTEGVDYVQAILRIVREREIDVIIPTTEASIYQLNPFRNSLSEGTVLACPPEDRMREVSDKASLFRLAEGMGVPVPRTHYLEGADDLGQVKSGIDSYPVVVKPALSKVRDADGFLSGGIMYAQSSRELEELYASKRVLQYPSMIQEKIVGPGTGLFTLFDSNRHLALFSHRRLLEKPPSGGVSVVSESVPLDEEMVENAEKLLAAVEWSGVAMVEFKRDIRDGKAKLMEINGRFWGTLQLAVTCGVDFPGLYLDLLQGRRPDETVRDYTTGHRMKWFFGTLDHLLIRMKKGSRALNLPPGHPSRGQSVKNLLMFWERNSSYDVLDGRDMGPFAHELSAWIRRSFRGNA